MSDAGSPSPPGPAGPANASAGALLRKAREAAGLHVAALAVSLRVPVRKIEALEADRWDELSDPVFVRALASSACRALRVDAAPVLALLPRSAPTRLRDDGSLGRADFPHGRSAPTAAWTRLLLRPPALLFALLLLAAALLVLWPEAESDEPPNANSASMQQQAEATPSSAPVASPAAMPLPAAVASGTGLAVTDPLPVAPPSTPAVAPAMATAPIVLFRAKASSWVEVVDARQVVVLRRTLGAGETASAAGSPPLSVVIGRADATEVVVRGQTLDVATLSKDNVARFEVR